MRKANLCDRDCMQTLGTIAGMTGMACVWGRKPLDRLLFGGTSALVVPVTSGQHRGCEIVALPVQGTVVVEGVLVEP
jgi:hypothetical protein